MADGTIRRRVEAIKRKKIASQKIVNLADYRTLKKRRESHSILVVDDDRIILSALKRILEAKGYRVLVARDGVELSRVLEISRLHMFLLDINLPWIDGYELCRLIKSHPLHRNIPLILMSALSRQSDIEKGYRCGCDDYIIKPFDMDHITQTVDEVLTAPY